MIREMLEIQELLGTGKTTTERLDEARNKIKELEEQLETLEARISNTIVGLKFNSDFGLDEAIKELDPQQPKDK